MSDLTVDLKLASQAFKGQVSWETVLAAISKQATALVGSDPTATALVGSSVAIVKQGLSNALGQVDNALAAHQAGIAGATEVALEAALGAATGGKSVPFNPLIANGIDQLVNAAVIAAHAWGLQAKAALVTPAS